MRDAKLGEPNPGRAPMNALAGGVPSTPGPCAFLPPAHRRLDFHTWKQKSAMFGSFKSPWRMWIMHAEWHSLSGFCI